MKTSKSNYALVKVVQGDLSEFLKDIQIFGRIDEYDGIFIIYGCKDKDQEKFYKGLLEYDRATNIQGFQSVEEVKQYWEEIGDMLLTLKVWEYKILEVE